MALALESLTFSVETKELENAIQKIKELGQAASSLNKPIEQLAKTATEADKKVEKASEAAEKMASSAESTSSSTKKLSNTSEELGKETDAVATKIERLTKQLSYLRNDQQLSVTGFTKSQAGLMAWADDAGATSEQLKMLSKVQDELNSIMGEQAFDKSVAGLNMLNRQLKEFGIMQELAGSGANLTSTQVKQLARDMEVLRQQNISLGKDSESGISQLKSDFMQAASRVNELTAAAKLQEKEANKQNAVIAEQNRLLEEQSRSMDVVVQKWKAMQIAKTDQEANEQLREQNRLQQQGLTMMDNAVEKYKALQIAKTDQEANEQLVEQERLLKQNATAMDDVANRWKQMQAQKADQEANKQLAEQNRLMQQGLTMMDSAVEKWKALQIAKEQEQLNEQLREQNRLQQQGATAMDSAVIEFYNRKHQALQDLVKAEQFLATQEEKLQFVTAKTAEGFTVASANALYRYEQSLKEAGVTEQEFIGRSSAYATALKARQDVSDTNARRKAATEELIRIEKQLEDQEKFLAYATAEFSKQQQQATAGTQNFSEVLNITSLRALFNFQQALRAVGTAESDIIQKSEVMRQQLLNQQQAVQAFSGSVNHLGRNIGVQFTDIFVSLYNGQPIMQVITQQGGQLADAFLLADVRAGDMSKHLVEGFKKILESYKLLFSAFAGLAATGFEKVMDTFAASPTKLKNTLTELFDVMQTASSRTEVVAFAFGKVKESVISLARATALLTGTFAVIAAIEVYKSVKAYDELTTSMIKFGGAIAGGVESARAYANELQNMGWSAGKASEYIVAVAKAGNLSEQEMRNLSSAAKELDTWLNVSFEDTAKLHSEIKKAPVEAIVKLAKETGLVSSAVLDNIIKYEQAGDTHKAVMLAMNESIRVHGEQVNSAKKNYSDFAVFLIEVGESIKKAYNSIFSYIFEKTSPENALAEQVKVLEERLANPNMWDKLDIALGGANRKNLEETLVLSKQELTVLKQRREEEVKRNKEETDRNKNLGANASIQEKLLADINRADAKKLSQQQYINAVIEEQRRLNKGIILDETTIALIRQQAARDWKKANESNAKPKTSFSTNTGNELVETGKLFEQRLLTEQKLAQDQLAILNNYYEAGFYSKGSYLAQELNLVTRNREQQLQILNEYNEAEIKAFADKEAQLQANAATAIAKGGNRAEIEKQLARNLEDLNRQKQTFNEKITGKQEQVYSTYLKTLSKSLEEVSKSTDDVIKVVDSFDKEMQKQQASRKADIEFTAATIGMSEKEIDVLKAKMQAASQYNKLLIDTAKAQADAESTFWEFVQNIDPMNSEALDKAYGMWLQLEKSKQALVQAGIQSEQEQRIAMQDAAMQHDLANYKKLKEGIADAISTALFEGGKEGKKKLRDIIVAELSKPITLQINAFVNSVLSDVIGQPGNASYGQGANSDILDTIGAFNSAYKLINNSISASITKGLTSFATSDVGIKMGLGTSNTSAVGPVKPGLTNTGTAVSSALNMAGNAYAGYSLQKSISGGYKTGESELVDAATVIASAIYGPLAGATAGVFNSAFGRKLKDQGLEGTFGGADGFDGNSYEFYKGGWFRSDKTKRKPLDAGVEDALETQFKALQTQTAMMAQTLGLGTDSVANFTAKIKVSFKGLNEEQINQRMAEEFGKVAESMASVALGTTEYTHTGETAVETLTRLSSSLTTVNGTFDVLGLNLLNNSLAGADMASQLVDLMGGQEAFVKATSAYYGSFYTEAERTETATRQLTKALKSIGVNTLPATREAFRDLVDAQDLTTASGREMFTSLIALAPAFDGIVDSVESVKQAYDRLRAVNLSNEQIAQQRIDLEDRWFSLTADANAIRKRELEKIDQNSRELQEYIWRREDELKVLEQRTSLENRLLQLSGDTVAIRAKELEAIDPSNKAIQLSIWMRENELKVLEQRTSLEDQLLQLSGDSASIRAKERSEIEGSNLALFDLIASFEDLDKISSDLDSALSNAASAAEKVKSIQEKATSNYVQAQDKVAEAQKKIKDIQNENLKQQIEKAKELSNAFSDLSKSMKDFVYGEIKPSSQLFSETLKKALAGNQEAMKELPNAATAAIEQAKNTSGTLEEYEIKRAKILAGVLQAANVADSESISSAATATSLEAELTPEQTALQQAQKELADALKAQEEALNVANAIGASLVFVQEDLIAEYKAAKAEQSKADAEVLSISTQLTNLANATADLAIATGNLPAALAAISINAEANIKSSITMATTSDLPTELKQIALASLNDLQSNFKVVSSNKSMPAEVKQVAMASITSSSSNFGVIAKSTSMPTELKQLALGAASAVTSNISTVVTQATSGKIPASIAELALGATKGISTTITTTVTQAETGVIPESIAELALGATKGISTTITTTVTQAETGVIPESIAELVLNSVNGLSTDVTANVIQSGNLDDASKATILSATDTIAKTFNVTVQTASGTTVPDVISNLALKTNEQLAKSLGVTVALAKDTKVPAVISNLAGSSIDTISRTISTTVSQAASGAIPASIAELVLGAAEGISTTITTTVTQAENGTIPESIAELVLNSVNGLSTDVTANVIQSGSLDEASKATILSATDSIAKTFNVTVKNANGTTVPAVISNLALKTNEQLAKSLGVTVELAKGKVVPQTITTLAATAADTVSKTISTTVVAATGKTIPQEIVTLTSKTTDVIGKTLSVTLAAAQAGKFPTWVTELALNSTNNAAKTVDVAIVQAATNKDKPWITNLKLLTADAVSKTVQIAMGGDPTLTAAQAALKITSADNLLKTVDLALSDSNLTADEKSLITSLVQNVDGTINIEGGSGILTALDDISLNTGITAANTSSEELAKVIAARDKLNTISQKPQELIAAENELSEIWKYFWDWTKTDGEELRNGISTWEQLRDRINQGTWWENDPTFSKDYGRGDSFGEWYAYVARLQEDADDIYKNWQSSITQALNEYNAAKQGFGNDSLLDSMGFSSGGYTGDGGKYQPAGIVHAGEVVFSQDDIARLGGVNVVEGIRTGEIPMFANGGIVQAVSPTSVQLNQQDNSELVEELQNLREEVKMLRAEARATAMNTSKTARILDDVTQGGTEVKVAQTEEFIALFGR